MTLPNAEAYTAQIDTVRGWFYHPDVTLFGALLAVQLGGFVTGDLLEIGTYRGKSAILLGYGLRPDEQLVVCDLFGRVMGHTHILQRQKAYADLEQAQFLANWDRWHQRRPEVHACESGDLDLDGRRFRFVHIDGCHSYQCVAKDVALAAQHAAEGAVIACDDYRTVQVPGVAAAVWQAVGDGLLYPFAATGMKLYGCASKSDQAYWLDQVRGRGEVYAFPGWEMVVVSA